MNYTNKKNVLSLLASGKSQLTLLSRSIHPQIVCHQVKTACKVPPPVKKPSLVKSFGQPTHFTHPHRISKGEIVPGIMLEEFKVRRNRLMEGMKAYCSHNGFSNKTLLVVIPSSYKKYMTEKIPYVFRQNSDFLYLTGCLEPDSVLVLISKGDCNDNIIFLRGNDPQSELWDGPRTGVDQATELFGVDKSMPISEFEAFIQHFFQDNKDSMLWYDYISDIHPSIHKIMQQFLSQAWNKVLKLKYAFKYCNCWEVNI